MEHFAELDGLHTVVLVHDTNGQMLKPAAEGIAKHNKLHQREDHRDDNKRGTAPEAAKITFDDGEYAMHGLRLGDPASVVR